MKKSNIWTLISLILMIAAVILFMALRREEPAEFDDGADVEWTQPSDAVYSPSSSEETSEAASESEQASSMQSLPSSPVETTGDALSTVAESDAVTESTPEGTPESSAAEYIPPKPVGDFSMEGSLFIGDSRTVGLMEYSGIGGADYFCTVGMTVYNIHENPVSVPNVGKLTLTELISRKKYNKIYVMLGINELGYSPEGTVGKYSELLSFISGSQPDAVIFIQANLHVTKKRSDSDKVINNPAINSLNARIAKLADGKRRFYIDANALFDDKNGALSEERSNDSAHVLAKYYKEWGEWIRQSSASLLGEGQP